MLYESGQVTGFIKSRDLMLTQSRLEAHQIEGASNARAFGLIDLSNKNSSLIVLTDKGRDFYSWYILKVGV